MQPLIKKASDPIRYILRWNKLEIGVSHDPNFGDRRHGRKCSAGYGHLRGSYGDAADGMALDVYIGPDLASPHVFKVEQIKPDSGDLDEYKYVVGCWDKDEAKELYLAHMPDRYFGSIKEFDRSNWNKYQKKSLKKALYQVGNYLYLWDGDRLVKASKVVPGQLSLFDESKHPRDEDGKFTSGGSAGGKQESQAEYVSRRITQTLKAHFFERTSKDAARKSGLNPDHPALGWDYETHTESLEAYRNGGAKALADHHLSDLDVDGDLPAISALQRSVLKDAHWDDLLEYASNLVNGIDTDLPGREVESSSGLVGGLLKASIEWAQEAESEDEPQYIREIKKALTSTDDLKKWVNRQIFTPDPDQMFFSNLLDFALETIDRDAVGERIANAMKLPQSIAYEQETGNGMELMPWEESEEGREYAAMRKSAQLYRLGGQLYVLAPDNRSLIKAGKRNWKESTEWTDDKGRKWQFNEKTRRWGLHPEHKKTKGKKAKPASTDQTYEEWEANLEHTDPKLKTLFEAIQEASDRFDATMAESKRFLEGLNRAATGLEQNAKEVREEAWEDLSIEGIEAAEQLMRENAKKMFGISDQELDLPDPEEYPSPADDKPKDDRKKFYGSNNIVPFLTPKRELQRKLRSGKHEIVPFKQGDRSAYTRLIQDWQDEMSDIKKLAEEANLFIKQQKSAEALRDFIDTIGGVQAELNELGEKFHQERVEELERIFKGKITRISARIAASQKRIFELTNPGKVVRVPKGTTQQEYAVIVAKMRKGDKEAIKQYSVERLKPKSKKKKPAPQSKKQGRKKKNE